jgi:hypothetical protein
MAISLLKADCEQKLVCSLSHGNLLQAHASPGETPYFNSELASTLPLLVAGTTDSSCFDLPALVPVRRYQIYPTLSRRKNQHLGLTFEDVSNLYREI